MHVDEVMSFIVGVAIATVIWLIVIASGACFQAGFPYPSENPRRVKKVCEKRIEYFQGYLEMADFILEKEREVIR